MKLPTQPYKGARDFYPEDLDLRNYMFEVMRKVVRSYGYEEYDSPLIEPLEIYKIKSGEEIVNEQTYSFVDRGGRDVAIRPEMTPSVSRMVAARRQQLAYPLRWFSLPNLWRYERPQRGRFREHWQLNVDLFGVKTVDGELELIMVADSIFKAFGASERMYAFRVNHRKLLDELFENQLHLTKDQTLRLAHLIDRRNKLEPIDFMDRLDGILNAKQKEQGIAEKLLRVLDLKDINDLPDELSSSEAAKELRELISGCIKHGINNISFDISLVRGFDYYNGLVFELYDNDPDNKRAMLGGGRYDGLVGLFGVDPLPTVGFGLGDATLSNFLQLHHLLPELRALVDIYVAIVGDESVIEAANKAANQLRELDLNVAVDLSGKKLGDQIKTAQKKAIKYVLIVGSNEANSQKFTLRDLSSSSESILTIKQIAAKLKAQ